VHFVNFCVVVGAFCEKSLFVVVHLHHAQFFSYLYNRKDRAFYHGAPNKQATRLLNVGEE
jgi:hypothetical protein